MLNVDGNRTRNAAHLSDIWVNLLAENPPIRFLSLSQTRMSLLPFQKTLSNGPTLLSGIVMEWHDFVEWSDFSRWLDRNMRAASFWSKTPFLLSKRLMAFSPTCCLSASYSLEFEVSHRSSDRFHWCGHWPGA
jgi:hypothetical protein